MKTRPAIHTLTHGKREIAFTVIRSDRKSLGIVVLPDLTVQVRAPHSASESRILELVQKKATWITRKLAEVENYHPISTPKNYVSGETIVYLGRQYRLKVEKGHPEPAKLKGRYLWVWVESKTDTAKVKRAVDNWYRRRAQETLSRYLLQCLAVANRHGVPEPQLTIRDMRTRWGSCSPRGRVTLNLKLVQVPVHCIEYVLMHELCHLKHHDHGKGFYSLLTRCMPDWRQRKQILDQFRIN